MELCHSKYFAGKVPDHSMIRWYHRAVTNIITWHSWSLHEHFDSPPTIAHPIQAVLVLARVGKADVLEGQHRGWQLVTIRELEVEGALMLHWRRQAGCLHFV